MKIQKIIPDVDSEKSSIEITLEVLIQIIIMFCGIIVIHRMISFIPTYSGFNYDHFALSNVILSFLIIVLSIQTKLGIKVNILVERLVNLWNGHDDDDDSRNNSQNNNKYRVSQTSPPSMNSSILNNHISSQSDHLDTPLPDRPSIANTNKTNTQQKSYEDAYNMGPIAANSIIGSSFGGVY